MKKIAILSFFKGHSKRGVESWVDGLAFRLSFKYKIRVYQSVGENSLKYQTFSPNMKLDWAVHENNSSYLRKFYLDYWSKKIFLFNFKIIFNLLHFSPDVIVATDGGWEVGIIRIFSWITGSKMVIVGQSGIGWDEYNNIYSFPDCFVALTEKAEKWANKFNPLIKVVKIPNAVDTDLFKPLKKKSKHNIKTILSVGALEKGKRMDKIIQAVSRLNNCKLVVIGEGSERNNLLNLAKKLKVDLELKVINHSDIYKEYQKADLFVSASEGYYSFEIVLIEAMASNLAVVCNNDEVRKEIVRDAGIFSDPDDTDKFSRDISLALETKWNSKPRQQSQKFSWESISKKYIDLFNDL